MVKNPANYKECGGLFFGRLKGPQKRTEDVLSRSIIALDADNADELFLDRLELTFGYASIWHSTYSHRQPGKGYRYRGYILPDRELAPDEYGRVARAIMAEIGAEYFDQTSAELARFMYAPSTADPAVYEHLNLLGNPPAPVDAVLAASEASEDTGPVSVVKTRAEDLPEPLRSFCLDHRDLDEANAEHDLGLIREGDRWRFADKTQAGVCAVPGRDDLWQVFNAHHPAHGTHHMWDLVRLTKFGHLDRDHSGDWKDAPSHRAMVEYAADLGYGGEAKRASHRRIATRMVRHGRGRVAYLAGAGWRTWTGKVWGADADLVAADAVLEETLDAAWTEARGDKELKRAVDAASTGAGTTGTLSLASRKLRVREMDTDPWLLNVQNGVLDLRTLELRPHDPALMQSKITAAAYYPQARDGLWERFLKSVIPNPDARDLLQRYAGQALIGETQAEKLAALLGPTRSGKSTITEALTKALGDYADATANELVVRGRYGDKPTSAEKAATAQLRGLRLATLGEFGDSEKVHAERLKRLTGGEKLEGRLLYANPVKFDPSHSFVMATNKLPTIDVDDDPTWGRFIVIDVPHTRLGDEDSSIKRRLKGEQVHWDSILTWAVEGLRKWHADGQELVIPESVEASTRRHRNAANPVFDFVQDRCTVAGDRKIVTADLYAAYKRWADDQGVFPVSDREFPRRLLVAVPGLERRQIEKVRHWIGIDVEGGLVE